MFKVFQNLHLLNFWPKIFPFASFGIIHTITKSEPVNSLETYNKVEDLRRDYAYNDSIWKWKRKIYDQVSAAYAYNIHISRAGGDKNY